MISKDAMKNLNREPPKPSPHTAYFALSSDLDVLKAVFTDAGFASDVRMWHQPSNWFWRTSQEYWDEFVVKNSPFTDAEFEAECKRLYEEEIKAGGLKMFEMLMILVFKD